MNEGMRFVLEIGVEELPTSLIVSVLQEFEQKMTHSLRDNRLGHTGLQVMGTPRRLVCLIDQIATSQSSKVTEIKGPARKVGLSPDGEFLPPALAFARSQQIDPSDLYVARSGKGEYVFGRRREAGVEARHLLSRLLPETLSSLHFARSMTWGTGEFRFIRPIRWILALLGDQVIDFQFAGLSSSRKTRGHRFLSPGPLEVSSVETYLNRLVEKKVLVDPHRRRKTIEEALDREARSITGQWLKDDDLLDQVNYLVEFPDVVTGRFEESYLELPNRVLITVMKHHQKYFACVDDSGRLMPFFLVVLNRSAQRSDLVVRGNERVLRARLDDARFFYAEDRKKPLEERIPELKGILFQENLGTLWDKTRRIEGLTRFLARRLSFNQRQTTWLEQASRLAKTDLTCEMVKEFPELQGYMARQYLQLEGGPEETGAALEDQYLPDPRTGRLPETSIGSALSLADKMDTIVSSFSIGRIPTGSEDPGGLRRQAQGIIGLYRHEGWSLPLSELVDQNLELLAEQGYAGTSPEVASSVVDFILNRLRHSCLDQGRHYSLINAVFSAADDDIADLDRRINALQELYDRDTGSFAQTVTGYTRAHNITRHLSGDPPVDQSLFQEAVERELFFDLQEFEHHFTHKLQTGDPAGAVMSFQSVLPLLNRFFDEVLIMCDDQEIQQNRLALLKSIVRTWQKLADLSLVVFSEDRT